jgi:hypothetical protein
MQTLATADDISVPKSSSVGHNWCNLSVSAQV